jgi:hypothetical protein
MSRAVREGNYSIAWCALIGESRMLHGKPPARLHRAALHDRIGSWISAERPFSSDC